MSILAAALGGAVGLPIANWVSKRVSAKAGYETRTIGPMDGPGEYTFQKGAHPFLSVEITSLKQADLVTAFRQKTRQFCFEFPGPNYRSIFAASVVNSAVLAAGLTIGLQPSGLPFWATAAISAGATVVIGSVLPTLAAEVGRMVTNRNLTKTGTPET